MSRRSAHGVTGIERGALFPDGPADASHLVGEGDSGFIEADPLFEPHRPALESVQWFAGFRQHLGSTECRSSAVDDQHSKVLVAALGDPPQPSSAAAGTLQGCDAQPGGEVATGLEVIGRSGAGDECSAGQQPDARDLLEQSDLVVVASQRSDLSLGALHPGLEIVDLSEQFSQHDPKRWRKALVLSDIDGMALDRLGPDGNGVAELAEAAAKAVDPGNAGGLLLLTYPMELLDLLLIDRAHGNRIDPSAAIGIDQGFGVDLIGFVAQPVFSDELSGEHDRLMTELPCMPAPEMGAAAGFEQHDAAIGFGEELLEFLAGQAVMGKGLAVTPGKRDLKDLFCEINGDESRLAHGLLLSWDIQRFAPECWHIAMPVKTREESISSLKSFRLRLHSDASKRAA